jgi:acetyltransferase-like isoleucine patch superfamily enzyme
MTSPSSAEGGLDIGDFCSVGIHTIILTGSDDFTGAELINPTIPDELRNVSRSFVTMEKHATLTTNITVLPGVTIGEGRSSARTVL